MDLKSEKTRENQPYVCCTSLDQGVPWEVEPVPVASEKWVGSREDGLGFGILFAFCDDEYLKQTCSPPLTTALPPCPIHFLNKVSGWSCRTTRPPLRATHGPCICSQVELPSLCTQAITTPYPEDSEGKQNGQIPKLVALLSVFISLSEKHNDLFFFPLLLKFWKCKVQSLGTAE